jgi:hypothetical protein
MYLCCQFDLIIVRREQASKARFCCHYWLF